MSKLSVTGSIAKISASRAIGWLQQPFIDFKKHRKAMLLNFLLVGCWCALQQILQFSYPWIYLILLFLSFSFVGTVIMNVHASVRDCGDGVTRMGGFQSPLLKKMLVENAKMIVAGLLVVAAVCGFLYYGTDIFDEKSAVVLGKLYSGIQEAQAIMAQHSGSDPKMYEELYKSIGATFTLDEAVLLRSLVLRIMCAIAVILILMCLVFSYFWAVPMFLAVADTKALPKSKLYGLSFWGVISLRNFLAWITFGLGIFVMSMFLSTFGQIILQAAGSALTMPVSILVQSVLYTYFLWCAYYIFCDLYCAADGLAAGLPSSHDAESKDPSAEA